MRVWTIANQKGGVGKTTTVTSLAGAAVQEGQRVLVIDTDPHSSLGYYFGIDSDEIEHTLFDIFQNYENITSELVDSTIVSSAVEGLDVLPSNIALSTVDRAMGHDKGMGLVLRKVLSFIDDRYDLVLIDCPPVLGVLMVNALAACQMIVIPVQTEFLAIKGLERMIKTLVLMGRSQEIEYRFVLVPTMYDKRVKASHIALDYLQHEFKDNLWNQIIPIDTKLRDASLAHLPPTHYFSHSRAALAYIDLFHFCMEQEVGHVFRG